MNLVELYNRVKPLPMGRQLFSFLAGKKIPYSGSIGALVEELGPGHARVSMRDRRKVRNHLNSIHAVALMNLAEFSSGLSLVAGLPPHLRAILVSFRIEYMKKSRGRITAEARCDVPTGSERVRKDLTVELKNTDGDTVCRAIATWLIGPVT